MDKQKLVKVVSVVTGIMVIGCIIYFIINEDWFNAVGLSAVFFGLWFALPYLEKLNKVEMEHKFGNSFNTILHCAAKNSPEKFKKYDGFSLINSIKNLVIPAKNKYSNITIPLYDLLFLQMQNIYNQA